MKIYSKVLVGIICIAFLGAGGMSAAWAADAMKITGTVNDDGQLVDDAGQVYEIADEGAGADAMEYSGEKMSIEGMVEEEDGTKTIVIRSFKLVE